MTRGAVVHVGLEKTGSTAIQTWLDAERGALAKAGILVPRSIGSQNHTRLVAACLDDGAVDNIKAHFLARPGLTEQRFRNRTHAAFDAEVMAAKGWTTLVITSELISSRLYAASEIARLVDWLKPHVEDVTFLVYLRRQDDLAVSRFSSALRAGHAGFDDIWSDLSGTSFPHHPPDRSVDEMEQYFDYDRILKRFEAVSGAKVEVRLYDQARRSGGIVEDFAQVLGATGVALPDRERRANPALSAEAQFVISELNRSNPVQWPSGARNEPYRALLRRVETEVTGSARVVPRAEAEAFLARFGQSNAAVARRYFGGVMFDEDFGHWPEAVDYGPMRAAMGPVVARYQADAAALPQGETAPPVLKRLMAQLRGWVQR